MDAIVGESLCDYYKESSVVEVRLLYAPIDETRWIRIASRLESGSNTRTSVLREKSHRTHRLTAKRPLRDAASICIAGYISHACKYSEAHE